MFRHLLNSSSTSFRIHPLDRHGNSAGLRDRGPYLRHRLPPLAPETENSQTKWRNNC